ncbi:MAG: hypothetical protein V4650_05970 [Pseudomonadota bacterium]
MKKLLAITLTALIAACGGAGSEEKNAYAGGIFVGTLANQVAGANESVYALVSDTGLAYTVNTTSAGTFKGLSKFTIKPEGKGFNSRFIGYASEGFEFSNGSNVSGGSISGIIDERVEIVGSIQADGGPSSSYIVRYNELHKAPSSFAMISGNYTHNTCASTQCDGINLNFSSSGQISGNNGNCSISGNTAIPNANVNVYEIGLTISCSDGSDSFRGLASYDAARSSLFIVYDNNLDIARAELMPKRQ